MSTDYVAKLLVGCGISEVDPSIWDNYSDEYNANIGEYLENEHDMFYVYEEGIVGFELPTELNISFPSVNKIQRLAKKFEKITNTKAKIHSVVWSY